jgi:hypothetical protein
MQPCEREELVEGKEKNYELEFGESHRQVKERVCCTECAIFITNP